MPAERSRLKQLALLFTRLGFTAFGGPAAHIAMMQEEVVDKRKWFDRQYFLDLLGATNLIPGPNSTEMAMHIGHERAGWRGLAVAGICFILPAVLITLLFAWLYKTYGQLPEVQPFLYGVKPAIIAVILAAIFPLARTSVKNSWLAILAIIVLLLAFYGISEIFLLFGCGIIWMLINYLKERKKLISISPFPLIYIPSLLLSAVNAKLFWTFLKIGSILYGSGYVLFAFLDDELVSNGIISKQELVDAIAVGQFTPGPVFSSVTFIGFLVNGFSGATVSTVAIFLPAFLFVAWLNPLVKKMRSSPLFASFLDAVNVASVALIVAICVELGKEVITDSRTLVILAISLVAAFSPKKINSALIILTGAVLGWLLLFI